MTQAPNKYRQQSSRRLETSTHGQVAIHCSWSQVMVRHCVLIVARKSIETLSGLFDIMCRMDGKLRLPRLIMRIQSSIAITVAIRSNQPTVKNKNNFYLTKLFLLDRLINRRMR